MIALLMLFLCVILHTMWSDKSLQLLCILPFGLLCLSAIITIFVMIYWQYMYVGGYCGLIMCAFIEQQKSTTNTRLAGDAFLLKLPPPSRNCADTFFERSFLYGAPYEWNKQDERV